MGCKMEQPRPPTPLLTQVSTCSGAVVTSDKCQPCDPDPAQHSHLASPSLGSLHAQEGSGGIPHSCSCSQSALDMMFLVV